MSKHLVAKLFPHTEFFSESNFKNFLNNFSYIDFSGVFLSNNVNQSFDIFYNLLYSVFDKSFPIRVKKCKESFKSKWITSDLRFCIRKKYKLLKMLKVNLISLPDFNNYKRLLNSAIKQAKTLYYLKRSFKFNGDVKDTWKFINDILDKNKREPVTSIKDRNSTLLNGKNMVDFLNSYFVNIIPTLMNDHLIDVHLDPLHYVDFNPVSFFFFPTSELEVDLTINQMKNKPTNVSDILFNVIKHVSRPLCVMISHLYNLCIKQGKYPDVLKKAIVTPIYKSGDRLEACNYRPISTLLSINKIIEKLTYNRMLSFINRCKLLSEYQYGFRAGKSTTDAIFQVTQYASNCLNIKKYVIYIFLDLKKAFDCVSHKILLNKLYKIGFRGNIHSLLESYLHNRYQCVNIENFKSQYESEIQCATGFLLFINDKLGL